MARASPLTVRLLDRIGELRLELRPYGLEGLAADLTDLAEQIEEARLNAISVLDHGELRPRRLRRLREIEQPREAA